MKALLIFVLLNGEQVETTLHRPLADCVGWASFYTAQAEHRTAVREPAPREVIGAYCKVVKP